MKIEENNYESLKNQTISPNLLLSKTDQGDEVQKRFRYQHTYTALVAIQMFAGKYHIKKYSEHR
jgi:hypothetical protein